MTIIVYPCNPDINITANNKLSSNTTTSTVQSQEQQQQPKQSPKSAQIESQKNNKRKSVFIENRKSPPATPVDNKELIMTKSPLGSQIDITSNLDSVKKQLDPNVARKGSKSETVVIHSSSSGGAVGNFFKNHLRNPSPSKNRHPTHQQTSPKSAKKTEQNISPTSTLTQQQKKAHEQRHGSFSSPFKMPKFTSNSSSAAAKQTGENPPHSNRVAKEQMEQKPDTNLISTATSALRRLHFKSGRNATKTQQRATVNIANGTGSPNVVPKVIVMGSSSTSETTINTSTDSANTIITTMTNTDEYLTEDSLDKQGDDSLDMIDRLRTEQLIDIEPAAVDSPEISPPHKTSKLVDTDTYQHTTSEGTFLFQDDDAPMTSGSADIPKTAFFEQKFIFETPPPSSSATKTPKSPKLVSKTQESKFNFDNTAVFADSTPPKTPLLKRRQSENLNLSSDKSLQQRSKKSTSSTSSTHHRSHSRRRRQSSPRNEMRQNGGSRPKTNESGTPKILPDLRVDYFSNSIDASASTIVHLDSIQNANHALNATPEKSSVCLNQCLREVGARLECALTTPCGAALGHNINVTTNPLDSSTVHQHSMNLNRNNCTGGSIPQATIVVQQPSLSLDSSGAANVSTVLLKNGIEFMSNVNMITSGGACNGGVVNNGTAANNGSSKSTKRQQQREENMKQLLDVANTLTLEELHDFEMRYGSPHHSRSQSVKTPGRSSGGRPNYLCLPQQRSRVASMPNTGVEEEYYRLRHFSITGKGVVNRGDSLKSRRSRSNTSVASSNSSTEHLQTQPGPASYPGSARTSVSSRESSNASQTGGLLVTSGPSTNGGVQLYRVAMLGASSVGKSSLVSQFMTSEYLHAYDTSIDDDSGEKTVSVLLAGEESELTFIDLPYAELSPENVTGTYGVGEEPQAYCVVYSCADRGSLEIAERALAALWTSGLVASKAVILVANKADLVRSRVVTTDEGKAIATQYDCKFIETSVGINHNVDELLVGLLTQIRLKLENPEKTRDLFRKRSCSKKNRNKSPNRVGNTITSALTSCGGGSTQNGEVDDTKALGYCWGTSSAVNTESPQNSPKKYRGTRTSASLKVKGLLGKVWARDSKSKSCENLHVL